MSSKATPTKITVLVKPNSRREGVEALPSGEYRVCVNAPPQDGRANEAVIAAVAKYWKVPKSAVSIVIGHKSKRKVLEILST